MLQQVGGSVQGAGDSGFGFEARKIDMQLIHTFQGPVTIGQLNNGDLFPVKFNKLLFLTGVQQQIRVGCYKNSGMAAGATPSTQCAF